MDAIEVFADVRCPFAHVGIRRVHERRQAAEAPPMRVRAWPLELVNAAPMDGDLIASEVEAIRAQVAPDLFAGFDPGVWPETSLPALALTAAAYEVDEATGERVALAVRDALFEHGRDIADRAVLAEIAEAHGVALPEPGHHEAVVAEWEAGQAAGVVGSPHFLVGGDGFFCPGLDIRHDDDGFHIERDVAAFGAFLDEAFG